MKQVLDTVSIAVDEHVIALYAELTDDYNPLHVDAEFAGNSPFGGIIAHGTMSLNLIWQAAALSLGADALAGAVLDIRFTRPVRIGDVIAASGTLGDDGRYYVWARDATGQDVIAGTLALAHAEGKG